MRRSRFLLTVIVVAIGFISGCSPSSTTEATKQPEAAATPAGGAATPATSPVTSAKPEAIAPAIEPRTVTLPVGTKVAVRTTSTLSTKTQESGAPFVATLTQPLMSGDVVIAPKGATVEGKVVNADDGGRVKGRATIAVQLTRIVVDGRGIPITTNSVVRSANTTKKKDAMKIGIGSGIGAAIGAIAGGGKGAAIGAGVGAGAGTGAVLATHGDPAVIPSESLLTFTLRAPVTVKT